MYVCMYVCIYICILYIYIVLLDNSPDGMKQVTTMHEVPRIARYWTSLWPFVHLGGGRFFSALGQGWKWRDPLKKQCNSHTIAIKYCVLLGKMMWHLDLMMMIWYFPSGSSTIWIHVGHLQGIVFFFGGEPWANPSINMGMGQIKTIILFPRLKIIMRFSNHIGDIKAYMTSLIWYLGVISRT